MGGEVKMITILSKVNPTLFHSIGISLIHSLWQSAILAILVYIILRWMRNFSAQSRYILAVIALLFMFFLPVLTFLQFYADQSGNEIVLQNTNGNLSNPNTVLHKSTDGFNNVFFSEISGFISDNAFMFTLFWLIGVGFMIVKFTGGVFLTYRVKHATGIDIQMHWQKRLEILIKRLKIKRKVRIFESTRVNMPLVIGYFKPVIFVPLGTFSQLPYDQLEMLLLHELAHIQRSDYLVNMIQSFIEILLFFNPFVWWISSVIRIERENCCDDLALGINRQPESLAKAIVKLSETSLNQSYKPNVLYFNKINTMKRIERMFSHQQNKPVTKEKFFVSLLSFAIVAIISTSGLMANSSDTESGSKRVNLIDITNHLVPVSDTLKNGNVKTTTKEVTVEMKDGKIVKAIVNGKEVSPEEFEKMEGSVSKPNNIEVIKEITVSDDVISEIETTTSIDNNRKIVVIKSIDRDAPSESQRKEEMSRITWEENSDQPEKIYNYKIFVTNPESDSTTVFLYNTERDGDSLVSIVDINDDPEAFDEIFQQFTEEGYDIEKQVVIMSEDELDYPFLDENSKQRIQQDLWFSEITMDGEAEVFSKITLSRKQLVVDDIVLNNKTHRHYLKRYEEISGRKLSATEAITFGSR
jgi:beta-lactamase regulating signal transducer with metallopeptidase domain